LYWYLTMPVRPRPARGCYMQYCTSSSACSQSGL